MLIGIIVLTQMCIKGASGMQETSKLSAEEALTRFTLSVPQAGEVFFGLGRNASYEAAKRGDLPTIKIGGRIVVPVAPLAEKLGLQAKFAKAA
jgi:hypothetical protein